MTTRKTTPKIRLNFDDLERRSLLSAAPHSVLRSPAADHVEVGSFQAGIRQVHSEMTSLQHLVPAAPQVGQGVAALCLVGVDATFTIRNPTTAKVAYSIRWSENGQWTSYTLSAQKRRTHYVHNGCYDTVFKPQIRFDSNIAPGYQSKSYSLTYQNVTSGSSGPIRPGTLYAFKRVGNSIDLYRQV